MFQVSISKLSKTETLEHGTPSKNTKEPHNTLVNYSSILSSETALCKIEPSIITPRDQNPTKL
jgi:hypothetical protein